MKSFAAFALFAASIASAQVTYNSTTGVFTCPASNPNGAFCASDSLESNIIIRCTNGVGQPGNCNDNLSGEFPYGLSYAPCWETSSTSGDAACSKNCVVYGGSGKFNGTFTLPDCTAISSSSSASSTYKSTSTASSTFQSTATSSVSGTGVSSSTTATVTTISKIGSTITTSIYTTTYCPSSTLSIIFGTGTGSGSGSTGSPAPPSNGTVSTGGVGGVSSAGSTPTATPVGPTKSASASSPSYTGGAATIANSAGSVLAAVGLAIAYFL